MSVFMLSLIGLPPLGGFTAKFYLFQSAVSTRLYILVLIAVINSVISAYYYLRVIYVMYAQPEQKVSEAREELSPLLTAVALVSAVVTLALGIFPNKIFAIISRTFTTFL